MVCNSQEALRGKETLNALITSIAAINILTALWTIAGNALCIFTFVKTRSLQTPSNILVAALCATDFYAGLIVQPMLITISFILPSHIDVCRLVVSNNVGIYFGTAVSFCLTYAVTLDRYIAICYPFQYTRSVTAKRYYCLIVLVIFYNIMMTIMEQFYRRLLYTINIGAQAAIFLHVIICYASIYRVIRQQRKVRASLGSIEGKDKVEARKQKEDNKKAYTIGIILIAYLMCFAPQMATHLFVLKVQDNFCNYTSFGFALGIFMNFLLLMNSAINPIVYCLRIKAIRAAAGRLLGKDVAVSTDLAFSETATRTRAGHTMRIESC